MQCAIWHQLYNLKNVKNTHGGVLLLVKLEAWRILFPISGSEIGSVYAFVTMISVFNVNLLMIEYIWSRYRKIKAAKKFIISAMYLLKRRMWFNILR